MQPNSSFQGKLSDWKTCTALFLGLSIVAIGCTSSTTEVPVTARLAFEDETLKIMCEDNETLQLLKNRSAQWSRRTGGSVTPSTDKEFDIAIIRPHQLGSFEVKKVNQRVPAEHCNSAHRLQWSRLISIWPDRLASWGSVPVSIPLAGESYVLIWNEECFEKVAKTLNQKLSPPTTWEDYAALANQFAEAEMTTLPSFGEDPDRALREFQMVAACYDRPALTVTEFTNLMQSNERKENLTEHLLSFYHDVNTSEPRLLKPGFIEAARWLQKTSRARSSDANSLIKDIQSGRTAMAIVSLAELGQLEKTDGAVSAKIGVMNLPGTKVWYDSASNKPTPPPNSMNGVNFVPFYGEAGWVGIVNANSKHTEAAFDFLTEISSLERSLEFISDPSLGFGPFRVEHLDQNREAVWQAYGFDRERTKSLAIAIRRFSGSSLANPAVGLRGSDRKQLMGLLHAELKKVVAGTVTPEDAMFTVNKAWRAFDSQRPKDDLVTERRKAVGLR